MKYKMVIFDFDGTLADTEDFNFTIYLDLADKYKIKKVSKDEMGSLKKLSAFELIDHLDIKKRNIPGMIRRGRKILHGSIENIDMCQPTMKSVLNTLHLKGILMGVLTSNSKKNVHKFLKRHELNCFSFVDNAGMFGKEGKLKKIVSKYGLSENEALYVGDEIRDITATKHVGMDIAAVNWGYNSEEALKDNDPTYLIGVPEELLGIIFDEGGGMHDQD
jgi:phosphoglycolate phosphatase-like HAD superfamily hydrolase